MLSIHKSKTGVAILGKPIDVLNDDIKYQGDFLSDSIQEGEKMALSALTSELLVLITARIPVRDRGRYLGRSQYPRFRTHSVCRANSGMRFSCEHLKFWYTCAGALARLKYAVSTPLVSALQSLLATADSHTEHL